MLLQLVGDRLAYGRGTKCVFLGFCCVGVVVMVTFLDVAHMVDAMLLMGVLGWGGVMETFLAVARMVDATLMMGVLGWGGGDGNVP